jgi:two-component system response regulator DegU
MTTNYQIDPTIKKTTILIAQDNLYVIELLKNILRREPELLLLGVASNGKELVSWLLNHNVDIIISDISLPILDGLHTMEIISNISKKTKFIFFTDYDDDWLIRKAIRMGASGFVSKQSNIRCITDAIKVVENGGAYIDDYCFAKLTNEEKELFSISKTTESV